MKKGFQLITTAFLAYNLWGQQYLFQNQNLNSEEGAYKIGFININYKKNNNAHIFWPLACFINHANTFILCVLITISNNVISN